MKYTFPVPPSVNRIWSFHRNGVYKRPEAQAYAWEVRSIFGEPQPLEGPIVVTMRVYRKRKLGDLDNYAKTILDALNGLAWHDDRQVVEIHAYRHDDKLNPRIEVEIDTVEA